MSNLCTNISYIHIPDIITFHLVYDVLRYIFFHTAVHTITLAVQPTNHDDDDEMMMTSLSESI